MKKNKLYAQVFFFCTLCLVVFSLGVYATGSGWQLAKEKSGVKVYTHDNYSNGMKGAKGVVQIRATVDQALDLLRNFSSYPQWMYQCSEAKLLKQISDTEFQVYSVVDAPFPVSDRDLVSTVSASQDASGAITLRLGCLPKGHPEKSGKVRIPRFEGAWILTPKTNGTIEVVYQYASDPGGSIPTWVANASLTDIPLYTLIKMKEKLEK